MQEAQSAGGEAGLQKRGRGEDRDGQKGVQDTIFSPTLHEKLDQLDVFRLAESCCLSWRRRRNNAFGCLFSYDVLTSGCSAAYEIRVGRTEGRVAQLECWCIESELCIVHEHRTPGYARRCFEELWRDGAAISINIQQSNPAKSQNSSPRSGKFIGLKRLSYREYVHHRYFRKGEGASNSIHFTKRHM